MKKFLLATSALVMTTGYAAAEVTFGGSAGFGVQYNDDAETQSTLFSYAAFAATMSGESDAGLAFGAEINIKVEDNGDLGQDDTTVFVEGGFGRLSFGAVGEADEVRGLSDVGWDGLDADDVAEALTGDELGDVLDVSLSHNMNYTFSSDAFSVSASARLEEDANAEESTESFAIGGRYNFADAYVGVGFIQHSGVVGAEPDAPYNFIGDFDATVISLYAGGSFAGVDLRALYAQAETELIDGPFSETVDATSFGLSASYTMDALTISATYGHTEHENDVFADTFTEESFGLGAAFDLGGGAAVSGGIAQIDSFDENGFNEEGSELRADLGMTFSF